MTRYFVQQRQLQLSCFLVVPASATRSHTNSLKAQVLFKFALNVEETGNYGHGYLCPCSIYPDVDEDNMILANMITLLLNRWHPIQAPKERQH